MTTYEKNFEPALSAEDSKKLKELEERLQDTIVLQFNLKREIAKYECRILECQQHNRLLDEEFSLLFEKNFLTDLDLIAEEVGRNLRCISAVEDRLTLYKEELDKRKTKICQLERELTELKKELCQLSVQKILDDFKQTRTKRAEKVA